MNTHDIELPPLPFVGGLSTPDYEKAMHEWCYAAIEADRKRQGDSAKVLAELVALIPLADTLNASASCQDLIDYFKGVIADRKLHCRPVYEEGWKDALEWADRKRRGEPVACFKCGHSKHDGEYVNVAPQPDEPSKGETVLYTSQKALDLTSRSDAVISVGLTRVPQMSWNVPLYTAPQPAEPVKCIGCEGKPAPENNPCAVCGKEAEWMKMLEQVAE